MYGVTNNNTLLVKSLCQQTENYHLGMLSAYESAGANFDLFTKVTAPFRLELTEL